MHGTVALRTPISGSYRSAASVLTDYLDNLFRKFRSENPEVKISLATFKRIRPKHILLMSLISRHTCLCTKHQNMALIAKAMKAAGLDVPLNPELLLKEVRSCYQTY